MANAPASVIAAATARLGGEEGRERFVYKDNLGYWTIGIGRLVDARKGGGLSPEEMDYLLANDIQTAVNHLASDPRLSPAWNAVQDNTARMVALIDMCFQLGPDGLAGFHNSLSLITGGKFILAGVALHQSLWARQTPDRANGVINLIVTGQL